MKRDFLLDFKAKFNQKGIAHIFFFLVKISFLSLLMLPIYALILIIRPIKLIRFGNLFSDRIGHFTANTELYLCEKDNNIQPQDTIDIFFYKNVCNYQLLSMWNRILHINKHIEYLYYLSLFLPGGRKHVIETTLADRDVLGLYEKSKVHLSFTPEENKEAELVIQNMGIENGKPYVCILGRDSSYLEKTRPDNDWAYHNYRNTNIQNYVLASDELAKRGYVVIRVGSEVNDIMKTANPSIIEYTYQGFRTELLDIYLPATCYFFISCGSGLDALAYAFRRPVLYVNHVPLEYLFTWNSSTVIIFKQYWLKKEKRFMKYREILESGAGRFLSDQHVKTFDIEIVENTPEEILEAAIEMDDRLKRTWKTNEEDEELQAKFWSLFKDSELHGVIRAKIGSAFLQRHRDLLN